ncbi:hypothetical protein IFM89_009930 [Coptis chinensis]|uniref:RRM domain-containing protein n=1 Tax=Coptis chinensis TaxID=261450 RepID=A0A835HIX7_9MAGN|nr:hypothetical protein IFM89_009930 [Coptis chinensis]
MAKAGKKYLTRTLKSYTDGIQETIQLFQEAPASTLEKVPWEQVVAMADQVSKQATIVGLLWKEATTELQALEENMSVYFKMLQGLLLLSHGTKVGAGPTLSSCIHASAKKVVECSLTFLREAVLSYGSRSLTHIPPLAGTVWEACESLKKTSTTNYTAIGRGITQAAVSVKDVVRELKELKPGNNDPVDDALDRAAAETSHESHSNHSSSEDDLGDDLNEEEEVKAPMRIFVGGLGEKVTEADLQKTFSSLGTVKSIEFVKTSGSSFAYVDLQPSSDKSLNKLFSAYNGCVWKGGRLRLEKAKEHYLVHLRREWEEDVEVAQDNIDIPEKPKLLTQDKTQLKIFFPSGTGKHKYSFRRVEVPSLPIHFCDCDEHCGASEIAKVKQISANEEQTEIMKEEELNMMRSVMDKIFNREVKPSSERRRVKVPTEEESPKHSIDDLPSESEADEDNDGDNIVINIVRGGKTKLGSVEKGRLENVDQESGFGKLQPSNVAPSHNKIKARKEVSGNPSDTITKKPRLLLSDESNINEFTSTMHKRKECPETNLEASKSPVEAQPKQTGNSQQLTTGHSWKQKSCWRELVGETAKSSFSISHILPKSTDFESASSTDMNRHKSMKKVRFESTCSSEPVGHLKDESLPDSRDGASIMVQSGSLSKESKIPNEAQPMELLANAPKQESKAPEEAQPAEVLANAPVTTGGHLWSQKSSWKELVGEMGNGSFSISNIVPDIASKRQNAQNHFSTGIAGAFHNKRENSTKQVTSEVPVNESNNVGKHTILHDKPSSPSAKEEKTSASLDGESDKVEMNSENSKIDNTAPEKSMGSNASNNKAPMKIVISKVCPFMRSNDSEKEWIKTRAALSGALKKKSKEK